MTDDKSIQEQIADAMPPIPEHRQNNDSDINMTPDEQTQLSQNIDAMIRELRDKGYSAPDLHVVFNGFAHRLNARQYDPHEYDRIALTINVRETVENWREEQDTEVPEREIALALRDLAKVYRENGRREFYKEQGRKEAQEND